MGGTGIAVVMMQKNEGALLDAWTGHYLRLTRPDLITILDNGSWDPATLAALGRARDAGIRVETGFSDPRDFARKGRIAREALAAFEGRGLFLLPCDCDEFLLADTDPALGDGLAAELTRLAAGGSTSFRIGGYFYTFPDRAAYYRARAKKVMFFDRLPPEPIDTGFHMPDLEGIAPTRLAYVHFHNKSLDKLLLAAREKLKFRIPDFRADSAAQVRTGRHMGPYFGLDWARYLAGFAGFEPVALPAIADPGPIEAARRACLGAAPPGSPAAERLVERLKCPFNPASHYDRIRLARNEADFLFNAMLGAERLFEWEMGGSTLFACEAGIPQVGSVAADAAAGAAEAEALGLGGFTASGVLRIFPRAAGRMEVPAEFRCADIHLLNGPQRVVAGAAVHVAAENPEARVFVPGFPNRAAHRRLLDFYEMETMVGRLACLRPRPDRRAQAAAVLARAA